MEAREANGGKLRLLPIKSGPDFVWSHWKVFFLGHAGKVPGVREVLTKVIPDNETAAAKTKKIKDDFAHNSTALSMLYEVCQTDGIASGVVTKQAANELVPCAQTLFKLLEGRFNKKLDIYTLGSVFGVG
jgi:catalase